MENKIEVLVCSGTVCYVMGGADLLLLNDKLPNDLKNCVSVKGAPCLDCCKTAGNLMKPPFAKVNGELIAEATVAKVVELIYRNKKG